MARRRIADSPVDDGRGASSPPPPPQSPVSPRDRPVPTTPRQAQAPVTSPAVAPPVQQPPDDEAVLLGVPESGYSPAERTFIHERLREYMEIMERSPQCRIWVNEALRLNVELQRHDTMVAAERAKGASIKWMGDMAKIRMGLMRQLTDCLEAIGELPKNKAAENARRATLADVHRRYLEELKVRRDTGQPLGSPTDAARELAEAEGVRVIHVAGADVLPSTIAEAEKDLGGGGQDGGK